MNTKGLKNRIKSVKNTQKMTKAMQLVSLAKVKKADNNLKAISSYSDEIVKLSQRLKVINKSLIHFMDRSSNKDLILIITSDKGLCGAYNQRVIKFLEKNNLYNNDFIVIGKKGRNWLEKKQTEIVLELESLPETISKEYSGRIAEQIIETYKKLPYSKLRVIYTKYLNAFNQQVICEDVLPLAKNNEGNLDYIYEPKARIQSKPLVDMIFAGYIRYYLSNSIASEHTNRMIAMKNATDNAGKMADELQVSFNKQRQAKITQEVSEIINGANIVNVN